MAWSHLLQSLKSIRWHFILSIKILDILTRPPSSSTLMISSFRGSFSNSSLSNTKMDQLSTLKSLEFTTNVFSCGIREIEIPSLYSNVKSTMLLWIRSLFLYMSKHLPFAVQMRVWTLSRQIAIRQMLSSLSVPMKYCPLPLCNHPVMPLLMWRT